MNSTTVVGYVRVSTDEQAASGLSLDSQRERIRAYCHARGWVLADIVTDAGWSASTLERPGMATVRTLMRTQLVDAVVAVKLDRLTRSVRDLHTLLQLSSDSGVGLVSVTENLDTGSAAGRQNGSAKSSRSAPCQRWLSSASGVNACPVSHPSARKMESAESMSAKRLTSCANS